MQICKQHVTAHAVYASTVYAQLQLVQALPPQLFVDPYELERMHLERLGHVVAVQGPIDLERHAPSACASA